MHLVTTFSWGGGGYMFEVTFYRFRYYRVKEAVEEWENFCYISLFTQSHRVARSPEILLLCTYTVVDSFIKNIVQYYSMFGKVRSNSGILINASLLRLTQICGCWHVHKKPDYFSSSDVIQGRYTVGMCL